MVKVIIVVVVIAAVIAGVVLFGGGKETWVGDLPPAQPIDPPAGAIVLPDEVRAGDVIRGVIAARTPEDAEAAAAQWVDSWTPMRGWRGAVKRIELRESGMWFSIEMFDSTIMGNQFFLYVELPGHAAQVKEGVEVVVRGRIKGVRGTPDVALLPGGIHIDQATVISPPAP